MSRTSLAFLVLALGACSSSDNGPLLPDGCEGGACSFCSAEVWGGKSPTAGTDVVIPAGKTVVVDCAAEAHKVTVEAGGLLFASRESSSTLTLHGNLVVYGSVDYGTPEARIPDGVTAEIIFTGMHDEDYVGTKTVWDGNETSMSVDTPMEIVDGDVGLWVMKSGKLAAAGQVKRAWSKLTASAGPGDPTFDVDDASGWKVGDRIALTPSAPLSVESELRMTFDESTLAAVDGSSLTLAAAPAVVHDGCDDCVRRAEAANLTRNVVIRSADATAHAHIMVAEQGLAQLDSVELRWLGPVRNCSAEDGFSEPARRAPLYFHQQRDASAESFVRHVAIWGAGQHFIALEQSNGVEVTDVAGYDTHGFGFLLFYDNTGCGTRCQDRTKASSGTVFDHVLAAKVGVPDRTDGCLRIGHRHAGIVVSGGESSGARDSVAVGVGWDGDGDDIAGFQWAEGGSGRPADFTFSGNVSHDNVGHGALIWTNNE
ncbi:MAG: hypothetical protein HOV81_41020, partial [Kofleriaceae bacterium]|nr:hypothetical protein [Kofleriaceae bacterium]